MGRSADGRQRRSDSKRTLRLRRVAGKADLLSFGTVPGVMGLAVRGLPEPTFGVYHLADGRRRQATGGERSPSRRPVSRLDLFGTES